MKIPIPIAFLVAVILPLLVILPWGIIKNKIVKMIVKWILLIASIVVISALTWYFMRYAVAGG